MSQREPLHRCFGWAWRGIWRTLRTQRNLRLQVAMAIGVAFLGVLLRLSALDWAVIVLAMASVFACEVMNSAIECLVDLTSPGYHELAGAAKDAAAGATLIAALASVVVGGLILGPRLLALVR